MNPDIVAKGVETCMKNYGVRFGSQHPDVREKAAQTCIAKYGVDKPAKVPEFKEKSKATCIKRYGHSHHMRDSDIANKCMIASKITRFDNLLVNRTGVTPLFNADEYSECKPGDLLLWKCNNCENEFYSTFARTDERSCEICNPKEMTWGEVVINNWLSELQLTYEINNAKLIKPFQLDFYIPEKNLAIEFNGIHWHSESRGRGHNYHFNKFKMCNDIGIKLIQVFEHELMFNEDIVKSRIMNALGKNQTKLYARKLQVKKITFNEAKEFFKKTHLSGSVSAKIHYALIKDDIIYSVMSFGKTRFSKQLAEWEMLRFSSLLGYNVIGAASKLFSAFIRENTDVRSVVSYANLQWGKGDVYEKLGFTYSHYSKPNYWYFKSPETVFSRLKFQKHKLPKELHYLGSEQKIMKHLKWDRFWDCGNSVWVWTR